MADGEVGTVRGKLERIRVADLAVVLALLALAGALRLHLYDQIPYPGETDDEYAYLFSGWSWLHEGAPTGWSWKEPYGPSPEYLVEQARFRLVTPWYDHPPLFSLLVGAAATLAGARDLLDAPLYSARLVAVALGTLAVPLLYLLARPAYGRFVAGLSALLFATVPTIVVASRLALAESLIVVLTLVALLATRQYLERSAAGGGEGEAAGSATPGRRVLAGGRLWLLLATLAAAAAGLAKVPGLTVGVSVVLLLAAARRWRAALLAGAGALAGLLPYVAYGWTHDRALFLAVLADQSGRAYGLEVLPRLLRGLASAPVDWPDSWMAFLWLALAYATYRRDRLLAIATLPYLAFLVAATGQDELRVWYREPLFPYLCLAGGVFLGEAIRRPEPLRAALVLFGLTFGKLSEAFDVWGVLGQTSLGNKLSLPLVGLLTVPILAAIVWPSRAAHRALSGLVALALVGAIAGSVVMVQRADEIYPPHHPSVLREHPVKAGDGLTLFRQAVEPTTVPPGGWLRLSTLWAAERDVDAQLSAYVRPFDRRSGRYGDPIPFGEAHALAARQAEEASVELAGLLPLDLAEGDYEVGVRAGGAPVPIGLIRVRATPAPPALQSVGRPTELEAFALDWAALGRPRPTRNGTAYPLLLHLRLHRSTLAEYRVFVHVTTPEGKLVAQVDSPPGGKKTETWHAGDAIEDWRDIVLPHGTPAGRYYLTAGIYDWTNGRRLRTPAGADSVPLGVLEVGPPLDAASIASPLGAKLAGGVELVGYALEPAEGADRLRFTLYWRAAGPIPRDYTVFAHLVDGDGLRAQSDGPPDGGRVPTSTWRAGQIVVDSREIDLAGLPAGQYRLLVGLYEPPDGPRLAVPGREDGAVEVTTVERR